jgi:hypothetical protein
MDHTQYDYSQREIRTLGVKLAALPLRPSQNRNGCPETEAFSAMEIYKTESKILLQEDMDSDIQHYMETP